MQVDLEDPKRFRIELTFSRGADLSPLEVNDIQFILFAVSGVWFESEIQFNSIPLGIRTQMVHLVSSFEISELIPRSCT